MTSLSHEPSVAIVKSDVDCAVMGRWLFLSGNCEFFLCLEYFKISI